MKGRIPFIVAIGSEPDGLYLGFNGILLAIYMVVIFYNLSIVIKRKIVYKGEIYPQIFAAATMVSKKGVAVDIQ